MGGPAEEGDAELDGARGDESESGEAVVGPVEDGGEDWLRGEKVNQVREKDGGGVRTG